jgi:hypothetical protein
VDRCDAGFFPAASAEDRALIQTSVSRLCQSERGRIVGKRGR